MTITDVTQIQPLLDFIAANDRLAYDTETTGLNVRKEKVIGFGISNGADSHYVCHQTWEGGALVEKVPLFVCVSILQKLMGKQLVTWNASFDMRITMGYFKVDLLDSLYSDGMLALHTIKEEGIPFRQRPFALKTVAAHYYGEDVVAEQADLKASIKANGGTPTEYYKADLEPMARYCCQDAALTFNLNEQFLIILEVIILKS